MTYAAYMQCFAPHGRRPSRMSCGPVRLVHIAPPPYSCHGPLGELTVARHACRAALSGLPLFRYGGSPLTGCTTRSANQATNAVGGLRNANLRCNAMPLAFEDTPGLAGRRRLLARRDHDVYATGPSVALARMIPAFQAARNADGSFVFELRQILWLLLVIIRPGDDIPIDTLLKDAIVHVNRLGVALERLIACQLDLSPCSPSVARARIKLLGMAQSMIDPSYFTAAHADLYATLADRVLGHTVPEEADAARLLSMVASDGTFQRLADAEVVISPRIDDSDRVAGCGLDFYFTGAREPTFQGMPLPLVNALAASERAIQIIDFVSAHTPEGMLVVFRDLAGSRAAFIRSLVSAGAIDASTIVGALEHLPFFASLITTDTLGPVALRLAGQVVRAEMGTSDVNPGTLSTSDIRLRYLIDRVKELANQPVELRVNTVLREHASSRASAAGGGGVAGGPGGGSAATDAGGDPGPPTPSAGLGYPKIFDEGLREKLNSAAFRTRVAKITAQRDGGGPEAHPFRLIKSIFQSQEILLWHPLLGYKEHLPAVDLVSWIATELSIHGPAFLGDLCVRTMLPPFPAGTPAVVPPMLDAEWKSLCGGSLAFDFETLRYRVQAHVMGGTSATYDTIPPGQRFTDETRLISVEKAAVPFYSELGFPSEGNDPGTPAMIFGLATTYCSEAKNLKPEVVAATVRTALITITDEASRRLRTALHANNPLRAVGGMFVIPDSHGADGLLRARDEIAPTNLLARQLASIRGQESAPLHIAADGLKGEGSTPREGGGPTGGKASGKATDGKTYGPLEFQLRKKNPDVKILEIGSNAERLTELSEDGKALLIGPQKDGKKRAAVVIEEFKAKAPAGACMAVWCSSHAQPWTLCRDKDAHAHKSNEGGAHKVSPANWRSTVLPLLLASAATLGYGQPVIPTTVSVPAFSMIDPFGSALLNGYKPLESRGSPMLDPFAGTWTAIRIGTKTWPGPPPLDTTWTRAPREWCGCVAGFALIGFTSAKTDVATNSSEAGVAAQVGLPFHAVGSYVTEVWDSFWLLEPLPAGGGKAWMNVTEVEIPVALIPEHMRVRVCVDELAGFCGELDTVDLDAPTPSPPEVDRPPVPTPSPPEIDRPPVPSTFTFTETECSDTDVELLPRRILHPCSGPYRREGGFSDRAQRRDIVVDELDSKSGGWDADLTNETCVAQCIDRLEAGLYGGMVMGPPCNFVTISRHFNTHKGPQVLFTFQEPDGVTKLSKRARAELTHARLIYANCCRLIRAASQSGVPIIVENPVPRHDPLFLGGRVWDRRGRTANHGSFWTIPGVRLTVTEEGLRVVSLAYCSLPGVERTDQPRPKGTPLPPPEQKYTMLAYSPCLHSALGPLAVCLCEHPYGYHRRSGGQELSGEWRTARLAPWPVILCDIMLDGLEAGMHAPRDGFEPPPRHLGTHHWAALGPAAWHPYGVPILKLDAQQGPAVVHLPVTMAAGEPRVGLPAGCSGSLIGIERSFTGRDADSSLGQKWADALFAPRLDIYSGWHTTLDRESALELSITAVVISDPPPSGLAQRLASTAAELAEFSGVELVWATASAIEHERLFRAVGALLTSVVEFTRPAPVLTRVDMVTGAMELAPVAPRGVVVASNCTHLAWDAVLQRNHTALVELRAELKCVIAHPDTLPDVAASLTLWLDCCSKDVDLGSITPSLQDSCYEADDPRLAELPFPAHAVPVASLPMAPLPPPPDQGRVPPWALDWDHVIKPWFYERLLASLRAMHKRLLYMLAHGTVEGAPSMTFFAFGVEGFMDWAARLLEEGHTLERVDGRIRLKDCSYPPDTHWERGPLAHALRHSFDLGLRDGVLTHGISYLADLEPVIMVCDHLQSLPDGFASVHTELARLADKGWYRIFNASRLDDGKLDLPCAPCRYCSQGSVARSLEKARFRRVVDNRQPRRIRFLAGSQPPRRVLSLAEACGWDESKAIRREARGAADGRGWMRHTPAFRRQQLEQQLGAPPPDPVATSKTPRQVRAVAMAEHADPVKAQQAVDEHAMFPRHPAQRVPLFCDALLSACILAHAAWLLGQPLLGFGDDESDAFHQFMTVQEQMWQCCILMLDPYAIQDLVQNGTHNLPPTLVSILEGCMSMGTPPSSGYAQRLNTELGETFEAEFHEAEADLIQQLCNSNARFAMWVDARRRLSVITGRRELCLLKIIFYADDPIALCAGGSAMLVRALVRWETFMGPRGINMLMGKAIKREIGTDLGWIGGRMFLPGLLGYLTGDKQMRTLLAIDDYLAGRQTCDGYVRLTGLENHLVCLLCMPYSIMYGVYAVHDVIRERQLSGTDAAPLLPAAVASQTKWRAAIAAQSGTSALAAAFVARAPPGGLTMVRLFSDAAKKGTTRPGICGNLYRMYWIINLEGAHLELPIVVTEFFGGIVNLIVFDSHLGEAPVAMVLDALVVPIIMVSKASSKSPMMQWMHALLLSLPEFARHERHLFAGQTYGPRNVITDAGSRGRVAELESIMLHFGMTPLRVQVPARVFDMLDRAVDYWRSLTLAERGLDTSQSMNSLGDGPPREFVFVRHSPPPPAVPAAGREAVRAAARFLFVMSGAAPPPVVATLVSAPQPPVVVSTVLPGSYDDASAAAFALPLTNPVVSELAASVPRFLRQSYAPSTNRIDAGYFRRWEAFCALFPTPPWRTHVPSNRGIDPIGHSNELLLLALALVWFAVNMQPRSHSDPAASPASAMQALHGVRREHHKHGITMAPADLAQRVLRGMWREYISLYGIRTVARKKPLTNAMILGMLATPPVTYLGLTCNWAAYFWIATAAWVQVLAEEGSRKEAIAKPSANTPFERGRLTFASLVWLIASVEVPAPSAAQLSRLSLGDGVYLRYGRAKNDQFGVFFATTPSFLPFDAHSPRNACRALAALEVAAAVSPASRATTPLFGPTVGAEFTVAEVDKAFDLMLLFGALVPAALLQDWSVHSFRIFVACALLAAHKDRATIKRHLRWRGDESLDIYARANNADWAANVAATYTATVDSTVAARLPRAVGSFDLESAALSF